MNSLNSAGIRDSNEFLEECRDYRPKEQGLETQMNISRRAGIEDSNEFLEKRKDMENVVKYLKNK